MAKVTSRLAQQAKEPWRVVRGRIEAGMGRHVREWFTASLNMCPRPPMPLSHPLSLKLPCKTTRLYEPSKYEVNAERK